MVSEGISMWISRSCLMMLLPLLLRLISTVQAIDCYKCTSINGTMKECEDEFNLSVSTVHLIQRECKYGHFRGTHCFKLKGERDDGIKITVRDCSDGDWGSHCGDIRYLEENGEHRIKGCLKACDHDGCNRSSGSDPNVNAIMALQIAVILSFFSDTLWKIIHS
ncbi:unnamed protein product [Candidula unifasciata]|uniref:Protein sleepless n=1 Tax=Candidula unifasciata TaxID=100452 RepID=A0A8S3YR23_9EUPU|nr:unnamed protein product [Candidula unifasciata]